MAKARQKASLNFQELDALATAVDLREYPSQQHQGYEVTPRRGAFCSTCAK